MTDQEKTEQAIKRIAETFKNLMDRDQLGDEYDMQAYIAKLAIIENMDYSVCPDCKLAVLGNRCVCGSLTIDREVSIECAYCFGEFSECPTCEGSGEVAIRYYLKG